jgi:hypothetical protein
MTRTGEAAPSRALLDFLSSTIGGPFYRKGGAMKISRVTTTLIGSLLTASLFAVFGGLIADAQTSAHAMANVGEAK